MLTEKAVRRDGRHPNVSPTLSVAVLGAGIMGGAMAGRLLGSGLDVSVWSRHRSSTADLIARGAASSRDPADTVTQADVVITMLPTAEAIRDVLFQTHVLKALRPDALWAQMGTIGVRPTEQLEKDLHAVRPDVAFVDAPVSGSRGLAEAGQLLILASGPPGAACTLEPVFSALGRSTLWLGPAGAGSQMKLVLNTWLAFQTEGAAESAALADLFGLRAEDLLAALKGNPLASEYALSKLGRMVEGDFHADFSLDWALKDLDLVASEAPDSAPVSGCIAERWRDLVHEGWGGSDVSAARNDLAPSAALPT
jgi:3-hydroxyisobutyrate dehydrogenase